MKQFTTKRISPLLIMFMFTTIGAFSQMQHSSKYKFKINVPADWKKSSYMDGTDKVFDYMSADENVAVQLRAFDAGQGFTTALLAQVYEQNMLPASVQKISLNDFTTSRGIPCKKGVYTLDYNGIEVGLSALYIVQNNKGYVLTGLIPVSLMQQRGEELKRVVKSFSLDGFDAPTTQQPQKKPTGLGGLLGSTTTKHESTAFSITDIKLSTKTDANNNAVNPTTSFDTKANEIFAVIEFKGGTNKDLVVTWIYTNSNRIITSDTYNFTGKNGGMAVVSLSKPTNDWPEGNYRIVFEMDRNVIRELSFTVSKSPDRNNSSMGGSSGNIGTGKNEVTISGNGMNGTYKFNKSGSYPIKWNSTVVIRGLDASGTNALELYLYNNKGIGTFSYGAATNGKPTFTVGAINGKGVEGSSGGSPTGQLTITEYKEGGIIKGHFTANVNGHNIKGSFSLSLSTPKDYGGYDIK